MCTILYMVRESNDILFFSGGTALNATATALANMGCACSYVITTFDSGGSSAVLRKAFNMPAVGDIRSRILALADLKIKGIPQLQKLFDHRLSEASHQQAQHELEQIALGTHPLLAGMTLRQSKLLKETISVFLNQSKANFPFAGASVGNLFIATHWLNNGNNLATAAKSLAKFVHARGLVLPVTERSAHLNIKTAAGECIFGQHRFTGKTCAPCQSITSCIEDIWLSPKLLSSDNEIAKTLPAHKTPTSCSLAYAEDLINHIIKAKAICFPMGSFYSSIIANLLPLGAGKAIARCKGPKIFIPNLGTDPELFGHNIQMQIERLLYTLQNSIKDKDSSSLQLKDVLSCIIVDKDESKYIGGIPRSWLEAQDIRILPLHLVSPKSEPLIDSELLAQELLILIKQLNTN